MFDQARRTWREFSNGQPGYRFQRQYRRRQETTNGLFDPKNLLHLAGGVAIIVIGVLLAPIPGPGGIIVFVGLAMVGSLFLPVARALDWGELRARLILHWAGDVWQVLPPGLQVVLGLLAVIIAVAVGFVAYRLVAGG